MNIKIFNNFNQKFSKGVVNLLLLLFVKNLIQIILIILSAGGLIIFADIFIYLLFTGTIFDLVIFSILLLNKNIFSQPLTLQNDQCLKDYYKVPRLNPRSMLHDINNDLQLLNFYLEDLKMEKKINTFYKNTKKLSLDLRNRFDIVRHSMVTRFQIREAIEEVIKLFPDINIDFNKVFTDYEIKIDRRMFKSIIYNFIDNSQAAYLKKYKNIEDLRIAIFQDKHHLTITDNSGGFKIPDFKNMSFDKKTENNNFLIELYKKASHFGIRCNMLPDNNGTKVQLTFI